MIRIRIELPFCFYQKEKISTLKKILDIEELNTVIDNEPITFKIKVTGRKHTESFWIKSYSKEPQHNIVDYRGKITLYCEHCGHIDLKNDSITFKECHDEKEYDLLDYYEYSSLDDDFYSDLTARIRGFIIACILTNPSIGFEIRTFKVFFDNKLYDRQLAITTDCISELIYHKQYLDIDLKFKDVLSWLYNNTSYFDSQIVSPVYFSAFSYLLNREANESLIYAVIGLENLFLAKNECGIKYALKNRLNIVFPNVSQESINDIYKKRSEFVHGNLPIDDFGCCHFNDAVEYNVTSATLASVLLIDSIRLLIKNNATAIKFSTNISYKYE